MRRAARLAVGLASSIAVLGSGCSQPTMRHHGRLKPYEGRLARPLPEGTVARGTIALDERVETGREADGTPVGTLPLPLTPALLERGRDRYDAYCTPCHGYSGHGDGVVVQRGFPRASSFHVDRLRQAPDGAVFEVITSGFGRMPALAGPLPAPDRWAIVAYLRALQLSQHAAAERLSNEDLARLDGAHS